MDVGDTEDRYPAEVRGRCISCGFFGSRGHYWHEIPPPRRDEGTLPQYADDMWALPTCFRFVADLPGEYSAALDRLRSEPGHQIADGDGNTVEDARGCLLAVLRADRQCSDWYRYTPGLSPKEHLERLHMMQLEEARRAHDLRLAEMERDAASASAKIEEDSLKIAKAVKSFTTTWTYAAFAVAFALLVMAVLAYVIPRH